MTVNELRILLQEAGGLEGLGFFYSLYPAIVEDNTDPEKRGRLKVVCEAVYNQKPFPDWIAYRGFGGATLGIVAIPQKGDRVFLECIGGNAQAPIWSYGGYTKDGFLSGGKENYPKTFLIQYGDLKIQWDTETKKIFIGESPSKSINKLLLDMAKELKAMKTATINGATPPNNFAQFIVIDNLAKEILKA
jgi:hypothetical protein